RPRTERRSNPTPRRPRASGNNHSRRRHDWLRQGNAVMCLVPWFSSYAMRFPRSGSGSIRSLAVLLDDDQAEPAPGDIQETAFSDDVCGHQIAAHSRVVVVGRIGRRPPIAAVAVAPDSPTNHAIFRALLDRP